MAQAGFAVAASSWAVLMGIAPILQIRRMLRERSAREVSLGGMRRLLVTCAEDNIGSRRVIEANGGVLADVTDSICHYRIRL